MHTKDFVINYGAYWEEIEHLYELLPKLDGIDSLTAVVKAINPVNALALMVASEQEKVLRVFDLKSEEKANGCK